MYTPVTESLQIPVVDLDKVRDTLGRGSAFLLHRYYSEGLSAVAEYQDVSEEQALNNIRGIIYRADSTTCVESVPDVTVRRVRTVFKPELLTQIPKSTEACLVKEIESAPTHTERPVKRISPSINDVLSVVAVHYEVSIVDIKSPSRERLLVFVRHIAMYLTRFVTDKTLPEIGRVFRRHHSTVISGSDKIHVLQAEHTDVRDELFLLIEKIYDKASW